MMARLPVLPLHMVLAAALGGCVSSAPAGPAVYQPRPGITELLSGPIEAAPGHHLVTGDLNIPGNAPIPRHYHHGEEFLTILGGSTVIAREGMGEEVLRPGQAIRIAPGTVHWGKAGPEGLRAVSSWVVPDGKPLRVAVPETEGGAR
ncbi:cupin domain-containing protein [Blastomonas sp. SL216]|uniref:cupin domain-containing protein n=1 Tax=Blastomonas sp. SL216 TaxID=2995169 RepID=UPI0023776806|nr:cupin domain-containing protein [Blastomonas sp. SL216]